MKIEEVFTRSVAEVAKSMPIKTITGELTDVKIMVLGSESTVFLNARREYMRHELLNKTDEESNSSEMDYAQLVSHLVTAWDFEEECTFENKVKLFYQSPYLAQQVENFALIRGNIVEKES